MSEKTVAIFLNSPYLGGAERSIILQAKYLPENIQPIFYIPLIDSKDANDDQISHFIHETFDSPQIKFFKFPDSLYRVSRSSKVIGMIGLLFSMAKLIISFHKLRIKKSHYIWANGNKAGFPLLVYALIFFYSKTFVWHFRDYPENKGIFRIVWALFRVPRFFNLLLLGNSFSVADALADLSPRSAKIETIYNPAGEVFPSRSVKSNEEGIVLGMISMIAPWKGIRFLLEWSKKYEAELIKLGVRKVVHYGGDIYQTSGEHQGHLEELRQLENQLGGKLWSFEGHQPPSEIYRELDIVIHPSTREEPFGRVIIEAYAAGLPVLSSGLGGAGELIPKGDTFRFSPGDGKALLSRVEGVLTNPDLRQQAVEFGAAKLLEVDKQIQQKMAHIFDPNFSWH